MKIYKISQLNPVALQQAQNAAMQSLSELMNTIAQFTEDQKNKTSEIEGMANNTKTLLNTANIEIPIDTLIMAIQGGNLNDIESISIGISSGSQNQIGAFNQVG